MLRLYEEWKDLKKNISRVSDIHKNRRKLWSDHLGDLFDIARTDALELIDLEEDKQFLIKQRMKGREGCMLGVDCNLKKKEERKRNRKKQEELRKKLSDELPSTSSACNMIEFSASEDAATSEEEYSECSIEAKRFRSTSCTKKQSVLTSRLAAVFDKLKISQRDAVHLLVAVIDAVGLNTSDYILNRTSISRERAQLRLTQSEKIIEKFTASDQPLTIHWDTKLLSTITGKSEDRLAIIATAPGLEQIIDMPDIPSGTGAEISSAVYDALEDKHILERTEAFVFDTTSSNTGRLKGACVLLERSIGREILFLGCRHHIFEIVLAAVFTEANVGENPVHCTTQDGWPRLYTL